MPDPDDPYLSNSCNTSDHGEETLSRGQRSYSTHKSEKLPEEAGINPEDMTDHMNNGGCHLTLYIYNNI
jgi:hypothetical protein